MENIRTIVCKNFNRLVEASPLSKKEIARQMQIDTSTLQRWKNGDTFPELPNIEKLAKVLGVNEREFYSSEEPIVKTLPMDVMFKRIRSVPERIYELAEKVGTDNDVWDAIEGLLEDEIEYGQKKKGKEKA